MLGAQNPTLQEVFEEVNEPNTSALPSDQDNDRLGAFHIKGQEKDGC